MSNPDQANASKEAVEATSTPTSAASPVTDVEKQVPTAATGNDATGRRVERWKREDMLKKCSLVLRWLGFLFSFLAFVVMVSNRHGKWINFEDYEEYRYVLAIAMMSTMYATVQGIRQAIQLSSGKHMFHQRALVIIDFIGDQIFAYLMISAASAAVPWTNRMRQISSGSKIEAFTDSSAAAISMAFLAFVSLAASAIISGYQLSTLAYI